MSSGWEKRLPFYYGWVIFSITFFIYMFMYALRYSIGIFFEPIRNEFGWTNTMTAGGVTLFFWVYALSAPIVGQLARKFGVRKTVLVGGGFFLEVGALYSPRLLLFGNYIWHGG